MEDKYIVTFDIETTGLDKTKDQIIQIAAIKFVKRTKKVVDKFNYYVQPTGAYTITIQAYLKHGIKPEFLADKPYFKDIAQQVYDFIQGCDILSYNGTNFDVPFLMNEFKRAGIDWNPLEHKFYDAFLEEKRRNGNKLEETYHRYYGKTMEEAGYNAHDAYSDVMATIGIFYAQQKAEEYEPFTPLTPDNVVKVMEFKGKQKECFTLGKYKDLPVEFVKKIDMDYINWCVTSSSFSDQTKELIKIL